MSDKERQMAELGKINVLQIKRVRDYGAHLDGGGLGDILLKYRELPAGCQAGDAVEVFLYLDREGRLRATRQLPVATVGQFAFLPVVANSSTGSYLDWGLEKDLFVPRSEQQERMEEGKEYLVYIFLDEESNRITASTKLDKFLSAEIPPYQENEEVDLYIYAQTDLGYKALVDEAFSGILYKNEIFRKLSVGQQLKGYIKKVRDDLKIDLTLQKVGAQGSEAVAQTILQALIKNGGKISVTDKSPPDEIYSLFGISKKSFKKAVGALYKKRLITIEADGIRRVRT